MLRRMALIGLLALSSVQAADAPAKPKANPHNQKAYLTPEEGGIDYKLQGEYVGKAGADAWGAQVIAMGEGKFHAVFLPGGLPGEGWDAKNRYEAEGTQAGDVVTFKGVEKPAWTEGKYQPPVTYHKGFEASLTSDGITAKTDAGASIALKKTERHSSTEGLKAPAGAIILFDGSTADSFKGTEVINGLLNEGGTTKQAFTDYTLHLEFSLPFMPTARGQGRGNSGVYNHDRYEVQVLDTFGVAGSDDECGGIYTKGAPLVNMNFPPLAWQTYDIEFVAPRYKDGKKSSEAIITVKHNGVLIQDHFKIDGPTPGGHLKEDGKEETQTGPIYLQNHGNPVRYRNIWIVEKK